jgi:nucleoside-diphosphate-sugar epimerase
MLVTGAADYIGSALCEHPLLAGHQVTALDNLTYSGSGLDGPEEAPGLSVRANTPGSLDGDRTVWPRWPASFTDLTFRSALAACH